MSRTLKVIETAAWTLGASALFYWATIWFDGKFAQWHGRNELKEVDIRAATPALERGQLVGEIEIPSVDLHSIIFEGADDATLTKGVGHVPGTASPSTTGNLVLAGHRDTYFRPLEKIRTGDEIDIVSPGEPPKKYRVASIQILTPQDTYVMRKTSSNMITLITCYPFTYFGSAPKRFVVQGVPLKS